MPRKSWDMIVFDVDGVLLDTSRSYPCVIREAIRWGFGRFLGGIAEGAGFTMEHFHVSKRHPAFNDDYDIAWALLSAAAGRGGTLDEALPSPGRWAELLSGFAGTDVIEWVRRSFGERVDRQVMRDLCEELYFGDAELRRIRGVAPKCLPGASGFWRAERPMLSTHWTKLPLPAGIYTGRPASELVLALRTLQWGDMPEEHAVTADSGILKPSPEGFRLLGRVLGGDMPLYFGDAESDRAALAAYGRGTFVAIGDILADAPLRFDTVEEGLAALLS